MILKGTNEGNGVYNQSVSAGSLLLEFGGTNNTLEECYNTAEAFTDVKAPCTTWAAVQGAFEQVLRVAFTAKKYIVQTEFCAAANRESERDSEQSQIQFISCSPLTAQKPDRQFRGNNGACHDHDQNS